LRKEEAFILQARSNRALTGKHFWTRLLYISGLLGVVTLSSGQMSEKEKELRELFLKSRQQMELVPSPTPTAKPTPTPASTARRRHAATPEHTVAKPEHSTETSEQPSETPEQRTIAPGETPTSVHERPQSTPMHEHLQSTPEPSARMPAAPTETPNINERKPTVHTPNQTEETPQNEQVRQTPTAPAERQLTSLPPTPKKRRPWFFLFGGGSKDDIVVQKSGGTDSGDLVEPGHESGHWRYLTPAVRRAIDEAAVARNRWKYIIVHNSGTRQGNARIFDYYHRHVRKMPNGLAYHFVIGNGTSSGDGTIEIGHRWVLQLAGGHCFSNYLNYVGIGICLVGDFNRDLPTQAQYEALDELIRYLRRRVGKIDGRYSMVFGHKEVNPRPTDCPGDKFPLGWLHRTFPSR
jgi:hypothetical protein